MTRRISIYPFKLKQDQKLPQAGHFGLLFTFLITLGLIPYNQRLNITRWTKIKFFIISFIIESIYFTSFFIIAYTSLEATTNYCLNILNSLSICVPVLVYIATVKKQVNNYKKLLFKIKLLFTKRVNLFYSKFISIFNVTCIIIYLTPSLLVNETSFTYKYATIVLAIQKFFMQSISVQFCTYQEILSAGLHSLTLDLVRSNVNIAYILQNHTDLIDHLNICIKIFSRYLLFTITTCSFTLVYSLYFAIENISESEIFSAITGLIFSLYNLGIILSICRACETVKSKAEKFNQALFRFIRDSSDLSKNGKLQLYVTMNQTINFTACGFFSLGYPLVTSIIAAATTYLVILVQFGM